MKVVILAGGQQSTISDRLEDIPKPMIEIGGKPLLWHLMKSFSAKGMKEFIICGGYRIEEIKQYFIDYYIYESDITVDLQTNSVKIHKQKTEDWVVTVVDTGLYSSTGLRVAQVEKYIGEENFIVTYGDCLSNINFAELVSFHKEQGKLATLAVTKPSGRNQLLTIENNGMLKQLHTNNNDNPFAWVNGGCYVFRKDIFDYLIGNYDLEKALLPKLTDINQVITYFHSGYWRAIETKRDLVSAENLWNSGMAPWVTWENFMGGGKEV